MEATEIANERILLLILRSKLSAPLYIQQLGATKLTIWWGVEGGQTAYPKGICEFIDSRTQPMTRVFTINVHGLNITKSYAPVQSIPGYPPKMWYQTISPALSPFPFSSITIESWDCNSSKGGATIPNFCNFFRLRTSHHSIPPAKIAQRKLMAIHTPVTQPGLWKRFMLHIVTAIYKLTSSQRIWKELRINGPGKRVRGSGGYDYLPHRVHNEQPNNPVQQTQPRNAMDIPSLMYHGQFLIIFPLQQIQIAASPG